MKDKTVKKITIIMTIVLILLTPALNKCVNQTRNEPGFGGECIAWMMPGLAYAFNKAVVQDLKGDWKKL